MSELGLLLYGCVGFTMSILSGVSGGGGGFIMTPLMIFLGLTPAQAVANGKFGGIFVTLGSLVGLKSHKVKNRKLTILLIGLALIAGIIAPKIITSINPEAYETLLGIFLIVLSPLIIFKRLGHSSKTMTKHKQTLGLVSVGASMLLVGVFSSGLGIFINISMMSFLGMSALDASVIKRYSQLFLNVTIVVGLITSGLFLLNVILVSLLSATLGGYVGGNIAIKKGSSFVSKLIAVAAFVSGVYLILI
jgi:uncharacterized membrane protein YfcA